MLSMRLRATCWIHLDPRAVRVADHAGDVDAARFEVDHEQHDVADEAGEREDLDGEEVGRRDHTEVPWRKVFHGIVLPRLGAGASPCSARMRLIVFRPSS